MRKDYNMGLAVLRMVMCFMVVLCHCWYDESEMGGDAVFRMDADVCSASFYDVVFYIYQPVSGRT